jgi:hypothetical protein
MSNCVFFVNTTRRAVLAPVGDAAADMLATRAGAQLKKKNGLRGCLGLMRNKSVPYCRTHFLDMVRFTLIHVCAARKWHCHSLRLQLCTAFHPFGTDVTACTPLYFFEQSLCYCAVSWWWCACIFFFSCTGSPSVFWVALCDAGGPHRVLQRGLLPRRVSLHECTSMSFADGFVHLLLLL